jgi:hypothetical protein
MLKLKLMKKIIYSFIEIVLGDYKRSCLQFFKDNTKNRESFYWNFGESILQDKINFVKLKTENNNYYLENNKLYLNLKKLYH